ncbi:class I SAM-dependent methyltransferase [Paenibacillus agilis]|uniref:class I SAM-dependent methyltransferase n=1 Tax=Paenibacillus agilis TaxID=3020863 RepID=UPI0021BCFF1D|nr:class I SAM-dependent methyltransferase [Paenibacillus agilis]
MVELSRQVLKHKQGRVIHSSMEEWESPHSFFHLVVSRLAIHYIKDIELLFHRFYRSLQQDGSFVFSVEHPVITSSHGFSQPKGFKETWQVDQYFYTGAREQEWLGGTAIKYHRTIEDYFGALQKAGFIIESLRESKPMQKNFANIETYERRMRIPLFLFLKARKQ